MITVAKKTVVECANQDPKFLASISIEATQDNVDNVDKLVEYVEHYKENMIKMKETLVKERGEGQEFKRKHETKLSENESLKKEYQYFETENDALEVHVTIMEGEKNDFEDKIAELELQKSAAICQVG